MSLPTSKMIEFFERRTHEHIDRVKKCLLLLADVNEYGDEIMDRGEHHDASKFGSEERIPYIWLTEYHRCKRNGERFEYPEGVEQMVKQAVHHHLTNNRHHYQSHLDPNEMSRIDLIEMVCDWTAMAQEFSQDGGSARGWADRTIGNRIAFNVEKRDFIYRIIEILDLKLQRL